MARTKGGPAHPLRAWRKERNLSSSQITSLVVTHGGEKVAPGYIEAIERGDRRPAWELCKVLAAVTDNAIDAEVFRARGKLVKPRRSINRKTA